MLFAAEGPPLPRWGEGVVVEDEVPGRDVAEAAEGRWPAETEAETLSAALLLL